MSTAAVVPETTRVPRFLLGTGAAAIREFRDQHIPVSAEQMDPQALQAWALLTRASIAAEANEIALVFSDGDVDGVREEATRLGENLLGLSADLALLLSKCEDAIRVGAVTANLSDTVEALRKKFDVPLDSPQRRVLRATDDAYYYTCRTCNKPVAGSVGDELCSCSNPDVPIRAASAAAGGVSQADGHGGEAEK